MKDSKGGDLLPGSLAVTDREMSMWDNPGHTEITEVGELKRGELVLVVCNRPPEDGYFSYEALVVSAREQRPGWVASKFLKQC